MKLTKEQSEILKGSRGETMARVMRTVALYGKACGAERLVSITSKYNHITASCGLKDMEPIHKLMEKLAQEGLSAEKRFTVSPRPVDNVVPTSFLQKRYFKKSMFTDQKQWEEQLKRLGMAGTGAFTCACYLDSVGNKPKRGEILSWAESSAVVYANSVLGARCNRSVPMMDLMCAIAGVVPYYGLLTNEGRKAKWIIKIRTTEQPDAQLLGAAVGLMAKGDVPYITGMKKWLGPVLTEAVCSYLKDFGAAAASVGDMGMFHMEDITPEAREQGAALIQEKCKVYVIDDEELERLQNSYPVLWKRKKAKPHLCLIGCPHLSLSQLINWTLKVERALQDAERKKVYIPTVFTAAPGVIRKFKETDYAERLEETGVILSPICPMMYMSNPYSSSMRVITPSNKLRSCTHARYYSEEEILWKITKGGTVT